MNYKHHSWNIIFLLDFANIDEYNHSMVFLTPVNSTYLIKVLWVAEPVSNYVIEDEQCCKHKRIPVLIVWHPEDTSHTHLLQLLYSYRSVGILFRIRDMNKEGTPLMLHIHVHRRKQDIFLTTCNCRLQDKGLILFLWFPFRYKVPSVIDIKAVYKN